MRLLLIALLACLLPLAGLAAPGLFPAPRVIASTDRDIELAVELPRGPGTFDEQAWLLAAPPGNFDVEWISATVRPAFDALAPAQQLSGDALDALRAADTFPEAVAIEHLGILRRSRLVRVAINGAVIVEADGEARRIEGLHVRLRFDRARGLGATDDPAFDDEASALRRLLGMSVANPGDVARFALPDAPPATNFLDDAPGWEPRPELSPGFDWLRIPVAEEGIFAIDGRWLSDAGRDPSTIDPGTLLLTSRGEAQPLARAGAPGAAFAQGARLFFHALASESPESLERAYWLGLPPDGGSPAMVQAPARAQAPVQRRFLRRWIIERDEDLRTRVGSFLSIREMRWVWAELPPGEARSFAFQVPGLPSPSGSMRLSVDLYLGGQSLPGRAAVRVVVNGKELSSGAELSPGRESIALDVPAGLLQPDGNTIELELAIGARTGGRIPPVHFDRLVLEGESLFQAEGGQLLAELGDAQAPGPARLEATGFRSLRALAFDVTDPARPLLLPVEARDQRVLVDVDARPGTRVLVVEDDVAARAPAGLASAWQDLRSTEDGADTIIIHHGPFAEALAPLVAAHVAEGRVVRAVPVGAVHDAWSGGEVTAESIRRYLRHAVTRWTGKRPTHVLLVGDCTSDGRNLARNDVRNLVPTWRPPEEITEITDQYACDAYFTWLVGDDQVADILLGRISVENEADAREAIGRQVTQRSVDGGDWARRIVTVADPGEFSAEARRVFAGALDPAWELELLESARMHWEDNVFLPRDRLSGDEVKVNLAATSLLEASLNRGAGIACFFGHGSPNIWSNQRIWFAGGSENSDNLRLANRGRLPFAVSFTCNNAAIDYPARRWSTCFAEDMMRVPNGGAVGCFMPSGPGYTSRHMRLAEGFFRALTVRGEREAAVLAEAARVAYQAHFGADDHSRMFILLADPALPLPEGADGAELAVEPPLLSVAAVQNVQVRLASLDGEPLASGTATMRDATGDVVGTAALQPTDDGAVAGPLLLRPSIDAQEFHLVARGVTASGRVVQAGQRVGRAPADIVIERVGLADLDGKSAARVSLRNRGIVDGSARLEARLPGEDRRELATLPVALAAGESTDVLVPLEDERGAVVVEFLVSPRRPESLVVGLPSAHAVECLVRGEPAGPTDLTIPAGGARLLPSRARNSSPIVEAHVANLGMGDPPAIIQWTLENPGQPATSGTARVGRVPSGQAIRALIPIPVQSMTRTSFTVRLASAMESGISAEDANAFPPAAPEPGPDDADPSNDALVWTVDEGGLPDLEVLPGRLEASPAHQTEGVTILVEGFVRNRGRGRSHPCVAALFPDGDTTFSSQLRSLAGHELAPIPALEPGQVWPFLLRWDPQGNLGTEAIRVRVDAHDVLVEPRKDNNEARVPLSIRSKFMLGAGGMAIGEALPPSPQFPAGGLTLQARVTNEGQTDARRVVVYFYRDEDQVEANLIGERLVDVVPAGETVVVEFVWDLRGVDLQEAVRPSFAFGIKGSLMRLSSVTAE